jgi:hypothetical protein
MDTLINNDYQHLSDFLTGKSEHTLMLFNHFVSEFKIANSHKRVAYITQLGKNFIHVAFPFKEAYPDNLCFQKIAQVPGDSYQFNHHFRMYNKEDINDEVFGFMKRAYNS